MIRVLIADDHDVVRFGLRSLLAGEPDMVLVAAAGDGIEAVALALECRPDVVLMDLSMPRADGFTAMRRIRDLAPEIRLLALTADVREAMIRQALVAGADGYVFKGSPSTEVVAAIRDVHSGGNPMSSVVAR